MHSNITAVSATGTLPVNGVLPVLVAQKEQRDRVVPSLISVQYASGAVAYYVRLGRKHGRKRIRLGSSQDLTLDAARRKAFDHATAVQPLLVGKTVLVVANEYLEAGRLNEKRTVPLEQRRLELYVFPAIGDKRVDHVTSSEIASIVLDVHRIRSDATRNRIVALLRALFNFAIDRGYCGANPTRELRMLREVPRNIPAVDQTFISKLFVAVERVQTHSPQVADLLKLLLLTGLRIGEALSLRWDDLNQLATKIYVRKSKTKPRAVPLNVIAQSLLGEMDARRGSNEFVFQSSDRPEPISRPYRILKKAFEQSGLPPDFCAHSCRHVFATLAAQNGVSLYAISKLLGHASPTTTLRYAAMGHQILVQASNQATAAFAAFAATEVA